MRVAVVTNIPAPYRVPVYNLLAREPGITLRAFYAARSEADRQWDLPPLEHDHEFLEGRVHARSGRYIHYNPGIWQALQRDLPDVVITTGYNPTHLLAWWWALRRRRAHVVMSDGTDLSERSLSLLHRAVRRLVFMRTRSYVVASQGGVRLLQHYGVPQSRIHMSPLCANEAVDWTAPPGTQRDVDLLFSARLVEVKNAGFALELAAAVAQKLGRRVRIAMLGHGPLLPELQQQARTLVDVDVLWAGHVAQAAIPAWFHRARLFVFPTRWDPWGVVANEACIAGVPVLVSPHAGAAGDLIRDGINGRVLPLDLPLWTDAAATLLTDAAQHQRLSDAARTIVREYDTAHAAAGMAAAVRQAAAE